MGPRENQLILVTPTHQAELSEIEKAMLVQSLSLNSHYEHCFVVPRSLDTSIITQEFSNSSIIRLEDARFESARAYNNLLLDSYFYELFSDFNNLLILQTDSVLIRTIKHSDFEGYDYVGAPWVRKIRVTKFRKDLHGNNKRLCWLPFTSIQVGNGGLSFRRLSAMIELMSQIDRAKYHPRVWDGSHNEDFVISYFLKRNHYSLPAPEHARSIFMEEHFSLCVDIPRILGFHAPHKYNSILAQELVTK